MNVRADPRERRLRPLSDAPRRARSRMRRGDGLEIASGRAITPAGCIELATREARARDARAEAPDEVARGGAAHAARAPGHDYQQGR